MFQRFLLALVWCSTLSLSLASIHPAHPEVYPHSAEIGKTGKVVYEIFQKGDDRPENLLDQLQTDYNCTTPHGLCIDDQHKYRLVVVKEPVFEGGGYKWFIGLEIEEVSVSDVGKYEMWKRGGVWNPGLHEINFAVWETDAHGRICQTSLDETSQEIVNNCTSWTTHPLTAERTTTERSTTEEKETTTFTQETLEPDLRIKGDGTRSNDALNGAERVGDGEYTRSDMILAVVFTFFGTVLLVLAVIWAIIRVREKRRRDRFDDFEGYRCGVKMDSRPYVNNGDTVHDENEVDGEPPA